MAVQKLCTYPPTPLSLKNPFGVVYEKVFLKIKLLYIRTNEGDEIFAYHFVFCAHGRILESDHAFDFFCIILSKSLFLEDAIEWLNDF